MIFRFADPWLLLALVLPLAVLLIRVRRGGAAFGAYGIAAAALRPSRGPFVWRALIAAGLALLIIAAARPQYGRKVLEREQAGRDLMLVIDLSGSMRIDDILGADGKRGDRLGAVFSAAKDFTRRRPDDRIGLVLFSTEAVTACPLTYDHGTVAEFLDRIETQQRALWARSRGEEAGLLGAATNMGLGLGTAIRQMKQTNALGRAVILITDGVDTRRLANWVDPLIAAAKARAEEIVIYGIGVGDPQGTMEVRDLFGRVRRQHLTGDALPDMGRLSAICRAANGTAFAASDRAGLDDVLKQIDVLQPTPRQVKEADDFSDRFAWPLAAGLILIALALLAEPRLRGAA